MFLVGLLQIVDALGNRIDEISIPLYAGIMMTAGWENG